MIGEMLADRYRIDAELGRGGMGVVYRAHDIFAAPYRVVLLPLASRPTLHTIHPYLA